MNNLIALFSSFLISAAFGQVTLLDTQFDFGTLSRLDQNYADFRLKNESKKEAVIFRVEAPSHVDVNFSSKKILPDSTVHIRLAYNPTIKGDFNESFKIYLSAWDKPKTIQLKGEATFSFDKFIPCPDFSTDPAGSLRPFSITARTLNNIPIDFAEISIFKGGRSCGKYFTDQNGEAELMLNAGRYFFSISGKDTSIYVNATNDHLVAFIDIEKDQVPLEDIENRNIEVEKELILEATEESSREEEITEEDLVLPLSKFKPNNLVFLVDVSTSMKHNGKLDLLKVAMVNLVDALRDVDRFTLISYAGESGVIMKTEENLDKQRCIRAIMGLSAGGRTDGTKAINRAGMAAQVSFIEGGNNQIILATDGAFNEGADKAQKLSAKFKRKGVFTSVLGIKCGNYTSHEMQELASMGGGNYIPLNNIKDAERKLLEEVKIRSMRAAKVEP
ncbi:MAG: VWA domain-containing protein [Flavobacteriales bacterium]|nr:VWA domain-containing protein [Flavobacteriales bacterium]